LRLPARTHLSAVHPLLAGLGCLPARRALSLSVLRRWQLIVLLASLLTVLLTTLLSGLRAGRNDLLFGGLIALLGSKTALGQIIGRKLAHTVIGADLAEKAIIRNFPFRNVITAVTQLAYDLCLRLSQNIGIFLENLDNLVSREIGVLGKRVSLKSDTEYNQRKQKTEPKAATK